MIFTREWAMPSADTFKVEPIYHFVRRYSLSSSVSVDPFARNSRFATYRNDLNPNTAAESHMDAVEFLRGLSEKRVKVDMAIIDPPYSPRQISECYQEAGIKCGMKDTQSAVLYMQVRMALLPILTDDAIVLSFGWNSTGMGRVFGFELIEILLCCHGGAHNDTICLAEKRIANNQIELL